MKLTTSYFTSLIGLVFLFISLLNEVNHAAWSPNFPIANMTGKYEMSISIAPGSYYDPLIGHQYLSPIMVRDNFGFGLYAQFLSSYGILGPKVSIIENSTFPLSNFKATFGSNKYLLIWTEDKGNWTSIKCMFLESNGTKGSVINIANDIPLHWRTVPDFAYLEGKFLIAYHKPYTYSGQTKRAIYGRFLNLNGTLGPEFKISSVWGRFDYQHIAHDGTNFLVVYRDDGNNNRVLARFVSPISGPKGQELIIDNNTLPSDNPLAVFFDGSKYLVVWPDQMQGYPPIWQFNGRFVYPNGTQTTPFPITQVKSMKLFPTIAFDGVKYLITWVDGRNCGLLSTGILSCIRTGFDLYGRYYSLTGYPLGGEFIVSKLSGNEIGGYFGRTIRSGVLGIVNRNVTLEPSGAPLSEDVFGNFWISSNYDIFAPEKGEKIFANNTYTIRWNAPSRAVKFDISYSTDNGSSWTSIKAGHTSKYLVWSVPPQIERKSSCLIKIEAYDSNNTRLTTFFSRPFSIEVVRIISPNGGELLISGNTHTIRWETLGLARRVVQTILEYSTNGTNWTRIATLNGNPGLFVWTIPSISRLEPKVLFRINFIDEKNNRITGTESEAVFTMTPR